MAEQNKNKNDEIDLLELFRIIGRKINQMLLWIVRAFLLIIVFFLRNALIISVFIVIGGLIGFAKYKLSKPYYSSEMIVRTNALGAGDFINYVNRLHTLAKDNNTPELSRLLAANDSVIQQIKDIQAYWIVDVNKDGIGDYTDYKNNFNLKDTTQRRLNNRVVVAVKVYNQKAFKLIQSGMHNYMISSPWVNQVNNNRKIQLKDLIAQIDNQISKLDSLENYEYFQKDQMPQAKNGQIVFLNEQEIKLFHNEIIRLYKLKQKYQKEQKIYSAPVTVIEDFTPLTRATNPLSKYIKIFILIFGSVGILFVFIKEQYNNIKKLLYRSS
ncbi:MAG: hypothetical protein GXO83_07510 [Chlorobi bacterium]|nr:hypothetical protein [Chlorobiota bacterium]